MVAATNTRRKRNPKFTTGGVRASDRPRKYKNPR
jgi:hypothetical protein